MNASTLLESEHLIKDNTSFQEVMRVLLLNCSPHTVLPLTHSAAYTLTQ